MVLYMSTLKTAAGKSSTTTEQDRRRRARLGAKTNGWLFLNADAKHDRPREIRVLDVSRLGVGFRYDSALEIGHILRVRVGCGPLRLAKKIKIVNRRENPDGSWTLGGEFIG